MIFVVEDEPVLRRSFVEFLVASGHACEGFESAEGALEAARGSPPDLVVTDIQLPGMSGIELVDKLGELDPGIVRIVMTAHASVKTAVSAMRSGCYEYLEKPVDMQRLARLVSRALGERRSSRELSWLRKTPELAKGLLGESDALRGVREKIALLASLPGPVPPVLISGETGVGKSLLARELHAARHGSDAPWIEVNCGALPGSLIEAELFGYERSAFTDARQAKPGLFEAAAGGTLFLDEIGELPLEAQSKLLRVVETGRVRRLGALRERQVDTAIVAASNVDLARAVADGAFREDLYHRLAAITLTLPPLRERADDIVLLAERFLAQASQKYRKSIAGLSMAATEWALRYPWPGNVRELQFAIERAVILSPPGVGTLDVDHLRVQALPAPAPTGAAPREPASKTAPPPERDARIAVNADGNVEVRLPPEGIPFVDIERAVLAAALEHTKGNVVRAARLLDLKRDALRYRIKKLGLDGHGA